jgi:exopolysaccharide biosynthesis polyprenyl glycosylphosphotransferase
VSSPFLHPRQKSASSEWAARLIPGTDLGSVRKPPQRETRIPFVPGGFNTKSDFLTQTAATPPALDGPLQNGENWLFSALSRIMRAVHFGSVWSWRALRKKRAGSHAAPGSRNVLIVGAGGLAHQLAEYFSSHPQTNRNFCGFLDDRKTLANGIIGRTSDLAKLARTEFVDEIILAAPHDRDLTLRVLREARKLRLDVKMVPDLFGCESTREPERIGGVPLICLHQERLPVTSLLLKRALDISCAVAALILMAPFLALIGILIRADSPGPVLYAALRAGRKGRPFRCFKFRTMVRNAESLKQELRQQNQRRGPFFKIADDPRITRVGRILRRYSLDELPQMWNVLKGEMSLVGPRPHPLDDFSLYGIEHLARLDVTPGITGLWQVTARRDPSFQTGMNLDVEYIQRWSLAMDFKILLKTAGAILKGGGE